MRDNKQPDEPTQVPAEQDIEEVDQDPGERQKENQNFDKDDPLAA